MKKKRFFYESPEFLIIPITDDVITESPGNDPHPAETETEDDDWGTPFLPLF